MSGKTTRWAREQEKETHSIPTAPPIPSRVLTTIGRPRRTHEHRHRVSWVAAFALMEGNSEVLPTYEHNADLELGP